MISMIDPRKMQGVRWHKDLPTCQVRTVEGKRAGQMCGLQAPYLRDGHQVCLRHKTMRANDRLDYGEDKKRGGN
jgi:hypothetical protein